MRLPPREKRDLELLLVCALAVPLAWVLALGWGPHSLISGHDGVAIGIPNLDILLEHRGDWKEALYGFHFLGGARLHDVGGVVPLQQLCGMLGIGPVMTSNLLVFLIQAGAGFLGVRSAENLASFWRSAEGAGHEDGAAHTPARIGAALLLSFAPVLAWRLTRGHESIVLGTFAFSAVFCVISSLMVERLTFTTCAVALVMLLHAFPQAGQQSILYSAVFGGPILLGLAFPWLRKARWSWAHALPFTLVLAAFGLSMIHFAGLLDNATGADAARKLGGPAVTYGYLTASFSHWLSSLPWTSAAIPASVEALKQHEVNYPLGPPLLLLALVPWRKHRALGAGLLVSAALALIFSMNAAPLSTWMLAAVPPLKSFRVPARAMLPFCLTVPVLASAALLHRLEARQDGKAQIFSVMLGAAAAALLGWVLAPAWREAVTALLAIAVVASFFDLFRRRLPLSAALALLLLGAASVSAFRERLIPYGDSRKVVDQPRRLGEQARALAPLLASALTRVELDFELGGMSVNTGAAMGLSSMSGYWFPGVRFLKLLGGLQGSELPPDAVFFSFRDQPVLAQLRQLYNVQYNASLVNGANGSMALAPAGPTAGPAWFSQEIATVASFAELGVKLGRLGDGLAAGLHRTLWLVQEDPLFARPQPVAAACKNAEVLSAGAKPWGQQATVHVATTAECPLTVAMNFAGNLSAWTIVSGRKERELALFPANGALTGLWVPAGAVEVRIEAVPIIPLWSRLCWVAGLLLAAASAWIIWITNRAAPVVEQPERPARRRGRRATA